VPESPEGTELTGMLESGERFFGFAAFTIEFNRLFVRPLGQMKHAERLLRAADLQPEHGVS
jgi:hypothetical protein